MEKYDAAKKKKKNPQAFEIFLVTWQVGRFMTGQKLFKGYIDVYMTRSQFYRKKCMCE